MAECSPQDNQRQKKRQADPLGVGRDDTDEVAFKTKTKDKIMKGRRKGNRFHVLEGETGAGPDLDLSWRCSTTQDKVEAFQWRNASNGDTLPTSLEKKNHQKRRKLKRILFWRKTDSPKPTGNDEGAEGDNVESGVPVEALGAASYQAEKQPEVPKLPPPPKQSTFFEMWVAEQIEAAERRHAIQEFRKAAHPRTTRRQVREEEQSSELRHTNSSVRRGKKNITAATCPRDKLAERIAQKKTLASPEAAACSVASIQDDEDFVELETSDWDDDHTCAICYDVMVRPQEVRPCGHVFCEACLRQLNHSTASRLAPRADQNARGRRNVLPQRDVLVLCPICRGPIQKCEAKGELNEFIRCKYPHRYRERHEQLQDTIRSLKNSRLPRSTASTFQRRQGQNQRVYLPRLKTLKDTIRNSVYILALCFGLSVLLTYLFCMIVTVGLLKFCFACVGKSRNFFAPEIGVNWRPFSFNMMRGLSVVLFFVSIKLFYTLRWGQLFCVGFLTLFITFLSYSLEGNAWRGVLYVVNKAIIHPVKFN